MENIYNISEAPAINTPTEFKNFEEYSIDNESKLKISFNDKLVSLAVNKSSLPSKDYQNILSLEQLYKINKAFLNFENTKDLVNWIINSLKQKTSYIKFIDNKCILQMTNPISNKQFEINLNQKEHDLNSRVTTLENYITEQNNKINNLQTFITEQKNKINNLESLITEQNKKNVLMEERIKQLEDIIYEYKKEKDEKEKEKKIFFYKTEILNKEAKDMLINWLPRKPIKLTLLLNSKKRRRFT